MATTAEAASSAKPTRAMRNQLRASRALFFCVLLHFYVFAVLIAYTGPTGSEWAQLIFAVVVFDVLFVLARRCSPQTLQPGDAETAAATGGGDGTTFCKECGAWQYNKSWHCRACRVCVVRWNCHCPLLNRCVGAHNHLLYVMFLGSATLALYRLAHALRACLSESREYTWVEAIAANALPGLGLAMIAALFLNAVGHFTWNCFLVAFDRTTPELLRPEKCFWLDPNARDGQVRSVCTLRNVVAIPSNICTWMQTEAARCSR